MQFTKNYSVLAVLLICVLFSNAQIKKIMYKESQEEFTNPERGFYVPIEAKASNYKPLNAEQLKAFHSPKQVKGLSAPLAISLVYRGFFVR